MDPSRSAWRIRLSRTDAGRPPDRWLAAVRHGLGLDEREARRLWKKLPMELSADLDDAGRDRLCRGLQFEGSRAELVQETIQHQPCGRHPKLNKSALCPKCKERACMACTQLTVEEVCESCATWKARRRRFRKFRITVLLILLVVALLINYQQRRSVTNWNKYLRVAVHPIPNSAAKVIASYIATLEPTTFEPVATFLTKEAQRRGVGVDPLMHIELQPPLNEIPPEPPIHPDTFSIVAWSLELRWWVWNLERQQNLPDADVRVFVIYHPAIRGVVLDHSIGLKEGAIGIVHAFATRDAEPGNNVVIAHELLHVAGATDKYDGNARPIHPHGYADPNQKPRHPQTKAELMGGRIPVTPTTAKLPKGLHECVVGDLTAKEIGWVK